MSKTDTPGAVASTEGLGLVEQLRRHYGHHFTTTRDGIVTGEHFDFGRHPLVGKAVGELSRARVLVEQCRAALGEELAAWDIDPPLHHVKAAYDACVEWLEA